LTDLKRPLVRLLLCSTFAVTSFLARAGVAAAQPSSSRPIEWVAAGGIHFMGPLRASVSAGMLGIFRQGRSTEALIGQLEAGLGGAKVRAGLASAQPFISGFKLEGSLMRTWGKPVGADRWRTYAGGEVHGILVLVNLGFGVYAPVGGGGRTLKTFTIGLGL
jgi:hypothetical protein